MLKRDSEYSLVDPPKSKLRDNFFLISARRVIAYDQTQRHTSQPQPEERLRRFLKQAQLLYQFQDPGATVLVLYSLLDLSLP